MKSYVQDALERTRLEYARRQRVQFERDLSFSHKNFTDPGNQRRLRKLKEDEQRAQTDIAWLVNGWVAIRCWAYRKDFRGESSSLARASTTHLSSGENDIGEERSCNCQTYASVK